MIFAKHFIVFLALAAGTLVAAEPVVTTETGMVSNPVDSMAFVKMFVGLMATIGLIVLLGWLSRKTKLVQSFSSGYQIKNLATLSITNREKLCLVEVGDKQILVGVAPGQISNIHVFDEAIEKQEKQPAHGNSQIFANQFKKALGIQQNTKDAE